eukprot:TRINITY_DN1296_c0_g1_i5.p1 TRINITY_DN1296_c0_g1~~TRINITY_DN1296_c0_g1_i5.p1  ORF type:complete len:411 (-),score=86.74 TRINITY_DN1296_c0_g1_i5:177-1409(-)
MCIRDRSTAARASARTEPMMHMVSKRTFSARTAAPAACSNILETIGNTPVVKLEKLSTPWAGSNNLEVLIKLESLNPGWSVKARPALNMLVQAEERGDLRPGMKITESSSGNTAVALAIACAVKGYHFEPVVDILMPSDKLSLLQVYGAHPLVVGKEGDTMGALKIERRELVCDLKSNPDYYIPDQYNNPDNAGSHMLTTGPEFVQQCGGKLDLAVVMMSTGGQAGGIGRYLQENIPGCQLLLVEPHGSTIYGKSSESYLNTGGGLDYKPGAVQALEDDGLGDSAMVVTDDDGLAVCRTVAQHEGILLGPSSGMALFAGLKAAELDPSIQRIGFIGCDDGRAYMSSIMKDFNPELDRPASLRERVQATEIETYVVRKPEILIPTPAINVPVVPTSPSKPAPHVQHSTSAI